MNDTRVDRVACQCAIAALRELLGDRLGTSAAQLDEHARDVSHHAAEPPDAVVFAESTDDVSRAVRICNEHGVPVIPYGTATAVDPLQALRADA